MPGVAETSRAFDQEAEFARIVLPLRDRMMRTVWRVARDPDLAEEAFQQALLTTWRKLPTLSVHPNPSAFVLRVCVNAACDQLRARQRRQRGVAALLAGFPASPGDSPVRGVEEAERRQLVLAALARLRPRQATALVLRAVHEEPYAVIAEALGCREATARVHVLRARGKLRRWLESRLPRPKVEGDR